MGKVIVVATDANNRFVAVSQVSDAAEKSGIAREDVIGCELWVFHEPGEAAEIRAALERCRATGEDQHMFVTSHIGGRDETWILQFIACTAPAVAILVSSLLDASQSISLEDRDLLYALAHDRTTDDYARDKGLSRDAVHTRLRRLRARFHVKSTPGLVGTAYRLGLI